jgi:electron transport complex protein RnfD
MKTPLTVTPSPHIRDGIDIKSVMYAVVVSLVPAAAGAVYFFGLRALVIIVLASVSAVLTSRRVCRTGSPWWGRFSQSP